MTAHELIEVLRDLDPSTLVTLKVPRPVGIFPADDHVETARLSFNGESYTCVILNVSEWP